MGLVLLGICMPHMPCVFSVENYSEIHFIKLVLGYKLGEEQIKC